jgi:putative transposase
MRTIKLNTKKYKGDKSLPTLSASEVRRIVSDLIAEHLRLQAEGYDCSTQVVTDVLVKASVEGEAIESTCDDLEAVPTGHTVRNYLNEQLRPEDLSQIEERINAALTADLPKRLWRGPLDLAADLHDEPFYGKDAELLTFACRGEAQAGTTYFYRVATLYHVHQGVPTTLAVTFVLPTDTTLTVLQRLLDRAAKLGLRRRCLYLDKGFCAIPVIRYLQQQRVSTIIACPIRGKKGGTRALCTGRSSYLTTHTFSSAEYGSCEATVAVVRTFNTSGRRRRRRKARWLVYVLINLDLRPDQVRRRYRSRFGVETSYRCMRATHAKTTSRNAALRFFLIALAFILVNVWLTLRWRFCQIPRHGGRQVDKNHFQLQRMIRFLRRAIEDTYGTVDVIQAIALPLDP